MDPYPYLWRTYFYINFHKTFFVPFIFFLRTSNKYLTRHGQVSVFKIRFVKTDPCLYFFENSPDVLKKKTKVLNIFNTDKNVLWKVIKKKVLQIRIRFYNGSGSPSLILMEVSCSSLRFIYTTPLPSPPHPTPKKWLIKIFHLYIRLFF